jgi:hypothetical protein
LDAATRSRTWARAPGRPGRRQPALDHPADRAPSGGQAPGTSRQGRLRFSSPGRGRTSLPGRPAPYPCVTLSDEGVKENVHGSAVLYADPSVTAQPAPRADLDDRRGPPKLTHADEHAWRTSRDICSDHMAAHLVVSAACLRTPYRMTCGNSDDHVMVEPAREEGAAAAVDRPGRAVGPDRAAAARRPAAG